MTLGIIMGATSKVFSMVFPGKSYRTNAIAARIPNIVLIMADRKPRTKEFLKATIIGSFWASFAYHLRLKPFIGKEPNCSGLNDKMITTPMGANIQIYTRIV
jgi:hypothetical protein